MDLLKNALGAVLSNTGQSAAGSSAASAIGTAVLGNLLGGQGSSSAPQQGAALLMTLFNAAGGIQGLIGMLTKGGLAQQVSSWIGNGPNQPVSGDQISQALGSQLIAQLAQQLGGNTQQTSGLLAQLLPAVINQLTPEGKPPAAEAASNPAELLGLLGGLLGQGGSQR